MDWLGCGIVVVLSGYVLIRSFRSDTAVFSSNRGHRAALLIAVLELRQ